MDLTAKNTYPWWKEWAVAAALAAPSFLAIFLYLLYSPLPSNAANNWPLWFITAFGLVAAALFVGWFLYAFTGDPYDQRTQGILFAYYFVMASFALVAILALMPAKPLLNAAITIVSGCVSYPKDSKLKSDELACNPESVPPTAKDDASKAEVPKSGATDKAPSSLSEKSLRQRHDGQY